MWNMLQRSKRRPLWSRLLTKKEFVGAKRRPLSSMNPQVKEVVSSSALNSSFIETSPDVSRGLTIGVLRETYDTWERRTPLCPSHVNQLLKTNSSSHLSQVLVQPSSQRCFSNAEYQQAGAILTDDLSQADILLGVKRPADPETMLTDKTYVFFSHVIKGQESNMGLLQRILDKQIQLVDYECIVDSNTKSRLVAFGKYAGLAGMLDTFYPLGRRLVTDYGVHTPFLQCPLASMQNNLEQAKNTVQRVGEQIAYEGLPLVEPLVICVTGHGGRVFGGAMEIFDLLPHEQVLPEDLPELFQASRGDPYKIYTVTPQPKDMYYRRDNGSDTSYFDWEDWRMHPTEYNSKFATHIAPYIHAMVNCIYWDPRYARLLTKDDAQALMENGQNRLLVVSDISCDINGSIEFLDRSCTIARPFFQYHPLAREEVSADIGDKGITVMGTDILPAELPKESSDHFGSAVVKVLNELFECRQSFGNKTNNDLNLLDGPTVLSNACITTNKGNLAPQFEYLNSFLQLAPSTPVESNKSFDVLLNGHLFDSGLINTILDEAELMDCGSRILNCRVNRGENPKDVATTEHSTAWVHFSSDTQENLDKLERKITALVQVMDKAEATVKVVDRSGDDHPMEDGSVDNNSFASDQSAIVSSQNHQKVLVLGAGRVSMSLVDLLGGRTEQKRIQVASDNEEEAKSVAKLAKAGSHIALDLNDKKELAELVKGQDVVISLLPAPLHPQVAEECIRQRTNLVTASYESPAMKEMNERAKEAGIIIVNEVGLDPGLDHMSAMKIIDDVTSRGGTVRSFQSVCGGLPAPEAANNPLKYKFSWSPKGVISASQNSARYRWKGEIVEVSGTDLMRAGRPFLDVWPEMGLECLPNRDSLKYEDIYGIDQAHTLFRGTLRYDGFCNLMSVFQRMGLFEAAAVGGTTWGEAIEKLGSNRRRSLDDLLLECAGGDPIKAKAAREALQWLGLEGATPVSHSESLVDSFCHVLENQLQYEDGELDMVAMHTAIEASFDDGRPTEVHHSSLLAFGDDSMSAMCRTVGFPAAAAADLILSDTFKDKKGLVLPTDKEIYLPILEAVEKEGIAFEESVTAKDG